MVAIAKPDLEDAEVTFPGITSFFDRLPDKPRTFLELVVRFERWREACARTRRSR